MVSLDPDLPIECATSSSPSTLERVHSQNPACDVWSLSLSKITQWRPAKNGLGLITAITLELSPRLNIWIRYYFFLEDYPYYVHILPACPSDTLFSGFRVILRWTFSVEIYYIIHTRQFFSCDCQKKTSFEKASVFVSRGTGPASTKLGSSSSLSKSQFDPTLPDLLALGDRSKAPVPVHQKPKY